MPIYAYKCGSCGHAKDVLQKISDAPLTTCPACGAESFSKQVTAAGFQLKGSGWYATDFRNGNSAAPAADASKDGDAKPAEAATGESKPAESKPAESKPAEKSAQKSAQKSADSKAPAATPAAKPPGPSASAGAGAGH
jgi:putative FmdB family regulatory protein